MGNFRRGNVRRNNFRRQKTNNFRQQQFQKSSKRNEPRKHLSDIQTNSRSSKSTADVKKMSIFPVYVGNIDEDVEVADLRMLFSKLDRDCAESCILEVSIISEHGFVTFNNVDKALSAVRTYNGHEMKGRLLHIDYTQELADFVCVCRGVNVVFRENPETNLKHKIHDKKSRLKEECRKISSTLTELETSCPELGESVRNVCRSPELYDDHSKSKHKKSKKKKKKSSKRETNLDEDSDLIEGSSDSRNRPSIAESVDKKVDLRKLLVNKQRNKEYRDEKANDSLKAHTNDSMTCEKNEDITRLSLVSNYKGDDSDATDSIFHSDDGHTHSVAAVKQVEREDGKICKIKVTNIIKSVEKIDVENMFDAYGKVLDVTFEDNMVENPSIKFAFLNLAISEDIDIETMKMIVQSLNQSCWMDCIIGVELLDVKEESKPDFANNDDVFHSSESSVRDNESVEEDDKFDEDAHFEQVDTLESKRMKRRSKSVSGEEIRMEEPTIKRSKLTTTVDKNVTRLPLKLVSLMKTFTIKLFALTEQKYMGSQYKGGNKQMLLPGKIYELLSRFGCIQESRWDEIRSYFIVAMTFDNEKQCNLCLEEINQLYYLDCRIHIKVLTTSGEVENADDTGKSFCRPPPVTSVKQQQSLPSVQDLKSILNLFQKQNAPSNNDSSPLTDGTVAEGERQSDSDSKTVVSYQCRNLSTLWPDQISSVSACVDRSITLPNGHGDVVLLRLDKNSHHFFTPSNMNGCGVEDIYCIVDINSMYLNGRHYLPTLDSDREEECRPYFLLSRESSVFVSVRQIPDLEYQSLVSLLKDSDQHDEYLNLDVIPNIAYVCQAVWLNDTIMEDGSDDLVGKKKIGGGRSDSHTLSTFNLVMKRSNSKQHANLNTNTFDDSIGGTEVVMRGVVSCIMPSFVVLHNDELGDVIFKSSAFYANKSGGANSATATGENLLHRSDICIGDIFACHCSRLEFIYLQAKVNRKEFRGLELNYPTQASLHSIKYEGYLVWPISLQIDPYLYKAQKGDGEERKRILSGEKRLTDCSLISSSTRLSIVNEGQQQQRTSSNLPPVLQVDGVIEELFLPSGGIIRFQMPLTQLSPMLTAPPPPAGGSTHFAYFSRHDVELCSVKCGANDGSTKTMLSPSESLDHHLVVGDVVKIDIVKLKSTFINRMKQLTSEVNFPVYLYECHNTTVSGGVGNSSSSVVGASPSSSSEQKADRSRPFSSVTWRASRVKSFNVDRGKRLNKRLRDDEGSTKQLELVRKDEVTSKTYYLSRVIHLNRPRSCTLGRLGAVESGVAVIHAGPFAGQRVEFERGQCIAFGHSLRQADLSRIMSFGSYVYVTVKPYNSFCVDSLYIGFSDLKSLKNAEVNSAYMNVYLQHYGLDSSSLTQLGLGLLESRPYIPFPSQVLEGEVVEVMPNRLKITPLKAYGFNKDNTASVSSRLFSADKNRIFVYNRWLGKASDLRHIFHVGTAVCFEYSSLASEDGRGSNIDESLHGGERGSSSDECKFHASVVWMGSSKTSRPHYKQQGGNSNNNGPSTEGSSDSGAELWSFLAEKGMSSRMFSAFIEGNLPYTPQSDSGISSSKHRPTDGVKIDNSKGIGTSVVNMTSKILSSDSENLQVSQVIDDVLQDQVSSTSNIGGGGDDTEVDEDVLAQAKLLQRMKSTFGSKSCLEALQMLLIKQHENDGIQK